MKNKIKLPNVVFFIAMIGTVFVILFGSFEAAIVILLGSIALTLIEINEEIKK